ncbi:MAG TPA: papain-like cysteine protease family protein, partial [Gemmatimonadaceae bacterium]|nr:papain-like cysteine protease family protein [Gemmatimonadaceae bacterium]
MRTGRWLVLGLVGLCTACASVRLPSAGGTVAPAPMRAATLQVPYIAQSVLLCGGAAIAMIERWWGRRGVYAEDFAALVRPEEGGIRTTDLAAMMSSRGWMVQALETTGTRVRLSLADSVPVIALIRVAERRYHYVVILGWNDDGVTYHDPAVSPSMTVDTGTFMRRWRGGKQWALFARPGATPSTPPAVAVQTVVDSLPCRPWLDKAADAAMADRLDEAE